MSVFNNREIATGVWLILLLAWALSIPDIRRSLADAVRAFCQWKILLLVGLMLLYVGAAIMLLAVLGFWKAALLKDTIVWFCLCAMAMMMRFCTASETGNILGLVLRDSLKATALIEFLANTYTFSLPTELILLPTLTFIALVGIVAGSDGKTSAVSRLANWIQSLVGLVLLVIVARRAFSGLGTLENWDIVRSIALTPLLSLILCPFLYALVLMSAYEQVFLRIEFGVEKGERLKRYARRRIVTYAGIDLKRIQHILRNHAIDLVQLHTETDVDALFHSGLDR